MDADISAALAPEALAPPIARDLGLSESAVIGVLRLLAAGAQPAFVARFRPERTGNLTLRDLERVQTRAAHAVAFEFKRAQLRQELEAKDRLDEQSAELLASARHPVELDDLEGASSRKRKRGGGAGKARSRGLGVLASHLWASGSTGPLMGAEAGPADADPLALAEQHPGSAPQPKPKKKRKRKKKAKADDTSVPAEAGAADGEANDETQQTASSDVMAADASAEGPAGSAGADEVDAPEPATADVESETGVESAPPGDAVEASMESTPEHSASAEPPTPPADAASDEPAGDGDAASDEPAGDGDAASDEPAGDGDAVSDEPAGDGDAAAQGESTDEGTPRLPSPEQDLAGARLIAAEDAFAVPVVQRRLRTLVLEQGRLRATVVPGKRDKGGRWAKLAERVEPIAKASPSHLLGLLRGEREGALQVSMEIDPEAFDAVCDELLGIDVSRPCGAQLRQALHEGWLGAPGRALRSTARTLMKQWADRRAIGEFCDAYRPLLLAPALGPRPVLAIDPGLAPGCKVAVLDASGEVLVRDTIYPLEPKLQVPQAKARIAELAKEHAVAAIVVNNGNGGRDVERLAREAVRETEDLEAMVVSGDSDTAGLFASSRVAKQQLPKDDASMRRAISAGRRLQDPLTELSKIDPRKLPLGQHQHEVDQEELRAALEQVLVSSINEIGVDVNRSTADELARVAGFSHALAKAVVAHREQHGPFTSRQALLEVPGVAGKAFEQGAGFLRIEQGDHALDSTTIHPERYAQVVEMAREAGLTVGELLGNAEAVDKLQVDGYLGKPGASGEPLGKQTLARILEQLRHPGADPRPKFEPVEFDPSLQTFDDLKVGMELPGVVTHLANFGAFVDVGIREEALVHVSELTHGFISSPFEAVHVGQRVRGRVIEISADRKRFSLSLRALQPKPEGQGRGKRRRKGDGKGERGGPRRDGPPGKGRRGRKGDRGDRGDRRGDRGGQGRGAGKDRDKDRVLGFKLDLSDLAKRLGKD